MLNIVSYKGPFHVSTFVWKWSRVPLIGTTFQFKTIKNGYSWKRCSKWSDFKTETFENASFSMENITTTTADLARKSEGKKNSEQRNEKEWKRSPGNTSVLVPDFPGEDVVEETVSAHPKMEWYENRDIWKRRNGNKAFAFPFQNDWSLVATFRELMILKGAQKQRVYHSSKKAHLQGLKKLHF